MAGDSALLHSPADILGQFLMDVGLGNPHDSGDWPVWIGNEQSTPDNAITVTDTTGRDAGRTNPDGERQEHPGVQIRVRATTDRVGFEKSKAIAEKLDKESSMAVVTIDSTDYLIYAVTRTGNVLPIGTDTSTTKRRLFTINVIASLRKLDS